MLNYAITDPKYYSNLSEAFAKFERLKSADFILFRDKICSDYAFRATEFTQFKSKFSAKFILHNDIDLALSLKADGIHFSSNNLENIKFAPSNLIKFASTHSIKEIEIAHKFRADFITFSPIFSTPNKGEPVGIKTLKEIVKISKIPVIALGGIVSEEQILAVKDSGAAGFASIRYFAN